MKPLTITDQMTKYPISLSPKLKASDALELMRNYGVRHFPIVEDHQVIGIVSERDIYKAAYIHQNFQVEIGDIMMRQPTVVDQDASVKEVVEVMFNRKLGSIIVVNKLGYPIGIFTDTDALELLAALLEGVETVGVVIGDYVQPCNLVLNKS